MVTYRITVIDTFRKTRLENFARLIDLTGISLERIVRRNGIRIAYSLVSMNREQLWPSKRSFPSCRRECHILLRGVRETAVATAARHFPYSSGNRTFLMYRSVRVHSPDDLEVNREQCSLVFLGILQRDALFPVVTSPRDRNVSPLDYLRRIGAVARDARTKYINRLILFRYVLRNVLPSRESRT